MNGHKRASFDLDFSESEPSTPSGLEKQGFLDDVVEFPPPAPAQDVYEATLPWWRAAGRRWILRRVEGETKVIARMQDAIRTPFLDAYFVYTSSMGTHTFFMVMLPIMFFFGHPEMGLGLISVLVMGVYFSSFLKDLFCAPRPFSPPVTRLTIGTHHLEYGFPSSHSTNSVSLALFFFTHVYMLATPTSDEPAKISGSTYTLLVLVLLWYTFSIIFGRLYTAMHSFTDCVMGSLLGAFLWWVLTDFPGFAIQIPRALYTLLNPFSWLSNSPSSPSSEVLIHLFKGLDYTSSLKFWVDNSGWQVPLIIIPLTLLAVNQHPQPVDDCPCFEDAIAFNSVFASALLFRWGQQYFRIDTYIEPRPMPGSGWDRVFEASGHRWVEVDRTMGDTFQWWGIAAVKMVVGISIVFAWRIAAKSLMHVVLPPIFRFLAHLVTLPHRRFYTPATDYKNVPSEFDQNGGGLGGLRPIPSVIDLPSTVKVGVEVDGVGTRMRSEIKLRAKNGNIVSEKAEGMDDVKGTEKVKHYDADVLTKVVVYAGIGALATGIIPVGFELLGWGVSSSPPGM